MSGTRELIGSVWMAVAAAGCNVLFADGFSYDSSDGVSEEEVTESLGGGHSAEGGNASQAGSGGNPTGGAAVARCDDVDPVCNECTASSCAEERCEAPLEGCYADAECSGLIACSNACAATDERCLFLCVNNHWLGLEKYWAMWDCLSCEVETCGGACAGEYQCGYPNTCSECLNSDEGINACLDSYEACKGEPACFALDWCLNYECALGDTACGNDCGNEYSAGITEYNAFYDCMFCNTASCGTPCAANAVCN